MDYSKLKSGTDIRGVAVEGAGGGAVYRQTQRGRKAEAPHDAQGVLR